MLATSSSSCGVLRCSSSSSSRPTTPCVASRRAQRMMLPRTWRSPSLLLRATDTEQQQGPGESSSPSSSSSVQAEDPHASSPSPSQQPATPPSEPAAASPPSTKITSTLSMLDSLLGVEEEERRKKEEEEAKAKAKEEEAAKAKPLDASSTSAGSSASGSAPEIDQQFQKIIDKAKRLSESQGSEADQAQLKQEFDGLLQKISKAPEAMSKEDVKRLKDAAFGPNTFWVTETQPISDLERTGLLIRGNLRDERAKVYEFVCQKVEELFGDKYVVLLVEDTLATEEDALNGRTDSSAPPGSPASQNALLNSPRVAFNIIPSAQAVPPQTTGLSSVAAFVLTLLLIGACGQLALAANITKLPKETLEWFSNPANLDTDQLPPGLENWDPTVYFTSALPIFFAILGTNVTHELGHRLAALNRNVRLGPTYFIPNFQIGSFGGITPFTQMIKDRVTMWDVSSAGPLTGAAVSALLLGVGLAQSGGEAASVPDMMVPVPTTLFQGSLLLGSITRAVLGDTALRGTTVLVSPLVIAGWCGLVTQALQLLPVGNVDGGRMVQAAFGRQALSLSSFFTYVGLGLGLLGSSLALPFGLYVIICQRSAEQYIKDTVTVPDESRSTITAVAVLTAVLVLLPMAPELAQAFGIGPSDPFF